MKIFGQLVILLVIVNAVGCDEADSNSQVIPALTDCIDGQTKDTVEAGCVYDGVCAESGIRLITWDLCVQENWEQREASVACSRETDGVVCEEENVCQGGVCANKSLESCEPGDRRNSKTGECRYQDTCSQNGSKERSWQECINNEWVNKNDVIVCEKLTDGITCGEGRSCQQGACIDLPGYCASDDTMRNSEYGKCEYSSICSETGRKRHQFEKCMDHQWVDMEEDIVCSRQTQGTSCGQGKGCESGECLDIPGHCAQNGETRNSEYGQCEYTTMCSQAGTTSHRFERCVSNQWVLVDDTMLCMRETDTKECGTCRKCQSGECAYDTDRVVQFSDVNLEKVVRESVGRINGDLFVADVIELKRITANDKDITSLEGIECLMKLEYLNLKYNKIENLAPLSDLTDLTSLYLWNNQIKQIDELSELTALKNINLGKNEISDITVLEKFTQLTFLSLRDNKITDVSPLADLRALTELYLQHNKIDDISMLEELTELMNFQAGDNKIRDISSLSGYKKLTKLHLEDNQIRDVNPLSGLENLAYLNISYNMVGDIEPLSNLNQLTELYLYDNIVSDISGVAELTNMQTLSLRKNSINDIAPLRKLTDLNSLSLADNKIEDISPLSGHIKLETLLLSNNKIDDIAALSSISTLKYLDLDSNQVADPHPLVGNIGIGTGDFVSLIDNPIACSEHELDVQALRDRVKTLRIDCP